MFTNVLEQCAAFIFRGQEETECGKSGLDIWRRTARMSEPTGVRKVKYSFGIYQTAEHHTPEGSILKNMVHLPAVCDVSVTTEKICCKISVK
jgi:hypothetical protein